jgi:hypothetical protein
VREGLDIVLVKMAGSKMEKQEVFNERFEKT